jgi:hypothetical protein
MSVYTTLGVTVSPEAGIYFLRFLKTLRDRPDRVTQDNDGTVSALWEDRNHFDEYSDCDYSTILDFLDNLGDENYISESITEDGEPDIRGGYYFGFARRITYDLYGDPVDLNSVMSGNRRRRFFGRRR